MSSVTTPARRKKRRSIPVGRIFLLGFFLFLIGGLGTRILDRCGRGRRSAERQGQAGIGWLRCRRGGGGIAGLCVGPGRESQR